MTKVRATILIALPLIFLMAMYFVLFRKKEKDILSKIPESYTSVAIIDIKSILPKLIFDDLGKTPKKIAKLFPDSLNLDWNVSGIGLPDKIAFFTIEDTTTDKTDIYFITTISKASRFNKFMDSLCFKTGSGIIAENNLRFTSIQSCNMFLGWNNDYLAGKMGTQSRGNDLLRSILAQKKEQSILSDSGFVSKQKENYDVMVYSKPYRHCPFKYLEYINPDMKSLVSYIQFNKGQVNVNTQINTTKGSSLNALLSGPAKMVPVIQNNSKAIVHIIADFNPAAFRKLYKRHKFVDIKENTAPILNTWDGRICLSYNGNKAITRQFVSYDYDDDFNRIEVRKSIQENIPDVQAAFGLFDSLKKPWKQSPLFKEGNDTLLFKGGDYILKKEGDCYLSFNKLLDRPIAHNIKPQYKAFAAVDFKRLLPFLRDKGLISNVFISNLGLTGIEITLSQNTSVSALFYFSDSNKNSLMSILDAL